jgi:branched-chain amino acid transport system substrate-binding protein
MKKTIAIGLIFVGFMFLILPSAGAKEEMVNIGVNAAVTGASAMYHQDFDNAVKLAVEELNGKGGITVKGKKYLLQAQSCDYENKSPLAINCARKLVNLYKTPVILTASSNAAIPLMKFNEKEGFMIMATSTTPAFTESGNKLVVRITANFTDYINKAIDVAKQEKLKRAATLIISTEIGKRWTTAFGEIWAKRGGELVATETVSSTIQDYYSQITNILPKKPEVIAVGGCVDEVSAQMVSQARELGYKGQFIFSEATEGDLLLKLTKPELLEGTILVAGVMALKPPSIQRYLAKYQAKYKGATPQSAGPAGFESVYIIGRAMEKAQTTNDVYKIREAMGKVLPLHPEEQTVQFKSLTANGDMDASIYGMIIRNGKKVVVTK